MADPARPVTGYPAPPPNPNGYPTNNPPPPPSGAAYAYPAAGYQPNPYYQQYPNANRRPIWLRRVLAAVIGLAIILGTVLFIVWLVYRPQLPDFRVDSFALTNFTLDSNSSIASFSANVRLTARNPNKKITLSYSEIEAAVFYESWLISDTMMAPFSQGRKNDTSLEANFATVGRFLDGSAVSRMNREKGEDGNVRFNLRILSRVSFRANAWRTRRRRLRVFCGDLDVGIPGSGKPGTLTGGARECREGF